MQRRCIGLGPFSTRCNDDDDDDDDASDDDDTFHFSFSNWIPFPPDIRYMDDDDEETSVRTEDESKE